jgi:poly(hydroxyalkanoate) granule-associated protein
MLKKAKEKLAAEDSGAAEDPAQGIFKSSHQIWLAGLGAFSRAQQEGTKVFEALVKQGEELQKRTKHAASETAAAARDAAAAKAKEVQQIAGGTWDKLEQVFEDRVARTLAKLGVYTQNDVQQLAARVDDLAAAVNRLIEASGAKSAAPAKGTHPKKSKSGPAAKKAEPKARKGAPK